MSAFDPKRIFDTKTQERGGKSQDTFLVLNVDFIPMDQLVCGFLIAMAAWAATALLAVYGFI